MKDTVRKTFSAHANLVYQAMTRQAGTLGKAILEGVMNSIDAKSTKIDIRLTSDEFCIDDDGVGIQTQEAVDQYFAVLGTPHEVDSENRVVDAKYGEYRMGRGQIFAQGFSVWKTGPFELVVDLKNWGLDFEQRSRKSSGKGCSIRTKLYESLGSGDLLSAVSEVRKFCKYVEVPVFLNGKQINTPPSKCKWASEDSDAYYQLKSADGYSAGIDIYQQGVFVERVPGRQYGLSGVVVTKGRLTLNFARNQAMRSCPVYKRIANTLKKFSGVNTDKKKDANLSHAERISVLLSFDPGYSSFSKIRAQKLFEDIQGKLWSINTIMRAANSMTLLPCGSLAVSFAEAGDRKADRLMEQRGGIVFDSSIFEALSDGGLDLAPEEFFKHFAPYHFADGVRYVPFKKLVAGTKSTHSVIPDNALTAKELDFIAALSAVNHDIAQCGDDNHRYCREKVRALRVGVSDTADGWTDGATYIAINRDFLKKNLCGRSEHFGNLVILLIHEYCHDDDDAGTHVHGLEFYKKFHDIARQAPRMEAKALQSYIRRLELRGKDLPRAHALHVIRNGMVTEDAVEAEAETV